MAHVNIANEQIHSCGCLLEHLPRAPPGNKPFLTVAQMLAVVASERCRKSKAWGELCTLGMDPQSGESFSSGVERGGAAGFWGLGWRIGIRAEMDEVEEASARALSWTTGCCVRVSERRRAAGGPL